MRGGGSLACGAHPPRSRGAFPGDSVALGSWTAASGIGHGAGVTGGLRVALHEFEGGQPRVTVYSLT